MCIFVHFQGWMYNGPLNDTRSQNVSNSKRKSTQSKKRTSICDRINHQQKKQTDAIIPVRCNYDKTIAKFLLPLEIDLDSGPCILRDTMRHNCHRPPSVVRFCHQWMPQHNRCRLLQQMVMHDASCDLQCFLPFVSIFVYLFAVSLDALPLLFFLIFPPCT